MTHFCPVTDLKSSYLFQKKSQFLISNCSKKSIQKVSPSFCLCSVIQPRHQRQTVSALDSLCSLSCFQLVVEYSPHSENESMRKTLMMRFFTAGSLPVCAMLSVGNKRPHLTHWNASLCSGWLFSFSVVALASEGSLWKDTAATLDKCVCGLDLETCEPWRGLHVPLCRETLLQLID